MNKDNLTDIVPIACPDCDQSWPFEAKHDKWITLPCDCKVNVHQHFPRKAESVRLTFYRIVTPVPEKMEFNIAS